MTPGDAEVEGYRRLAAWLLTDAIKGLRSPDTKCRKSAAHFLGLGTAGAFPGQRSRLPLWCDILGRDVGTVRAAAQRTSRSIPLSSAGNRIETTER